jgi:drug/metabolite transporter (DMT)-like permease
MHFLGPAILLFLSAVVPMEGGLDRSVLPAILFIGVICTTIPTVLWTRALKHINVVTSATVLMMESAFAVFLSWLILGEVLDRYSIFGAIMVFAAIFLLAKNDGK